MQRVNVPNDSDDDDASLGDNDTLVNQVSNLREIRCPLRFKNKMTHELLYFWYYIFIKPLDCQEE